MLNKTEFLDRQNRAIEGLQVYSRDGENLGKVTALDEDSFVIEKGFFFPQEFTARYSDINDVRDDGLYLSLSKDDLESWRNDQYEGWGEYDRRNASDRLETDATRAEDRDVTMAGRGRGREEDVRIPIAEEHLEAHKQMRETGQVRLRKVVHTELKHLTVPIRKEEVEIERVPAGKRDLKPGDVDFKEETISVPVREEEVTVSKRPVVKEEVRVRREVREEKRDVSGEVKRQDVEVDRRDEEIRRRDDGASRRKVS